MKTKIGFLALFLVGFVLLSPLAKAYGPEEKRFGLGLYLGEPTGITGKYYFTEQVSFQGVGSWSFFDEAATIIGDVLYDVHDLSGNSSDFSLPFYVGFGGKFTIHDNSGDDDSTFGVHVPVGIAWQAGDFPLEIAFEIAPGIDLAPETEFDVNGGIILRFYF